MARSPLCGAPGGALPAARKTPDMKPALACWTATVAIACGGLAGCGAPEPQSARAGVESGGAPSSPPILLITIDTLRWDALGSYGGARTPALDALARSGTRFARALAHAVVTLPSHTSILTGLDPSRHGVHDNTGFRVDEGLLTWAERLKAHDYATGAFIGAFPLDSQFGIDQGFDLYDDFYSSNDPNLFRMLERPATEVVAAAREWIGGRQGPWFAWVHVYDPHAPYRPPPRYFEQEGDAYRGEVAATDAALAPLLADAKRSGAVVIVTSDHGESLGERGERSHGVFAYEATLRVPLIIAGVPGERAGQVPEMRVRHIDILPTVLDLLGLPAEGTQGRSLLPVLRGEVLPQAPASYFEALTSFYTRNWAPLRGIYEGRYKYIDLPIAELYDTEADAGESDNLAVRRGREARALAEMLGAHLEGGLADAGPMPEDSETLRRLRALGYFGGAGAAAADREYGPEDDPKNLIELDAKLSDAVVAADAGQDEIARQLLEQVVAERPDLTQAQKLLAAVESRTGRLRAAVERLERVAHEDDGSAYVLTRLAFYYREVGRLEDAGRTLERALVLEPENIEAMTLLAAVRGMARRPEEAQAILRRALEIDPTNALVHSNLGTTYLDMAQPGRAREAFETALRYDAQLADAHNGLGVIDYEEGDLAGAVEHWRTAIALDPGQLDAMENLARTLVALDRPAEAVEVLERFVRIVPGRDDMQQLLVQLKRAAARS